VVGIKGKSGGVRDGAGRPSTNTKPINKRVPIEVLDHLKKLANDAGVNETQALIHCIKSTKKVPKKS